MTSRLAKNLERDRSVLEHERAHPTVADLVCMMCVRTAPPGQQRCQVCGGTLMFDQAMGVGLSR